MNIIGVGSKGKINETFELLIGYIRIILSNMTFFLKETGIELSILERVVGPELQMKCVENEEWWDYNINQIFQRIEGGICLH